MRLMMRKRTPDEVEQEVTQRDQFNTDTVGLSEALVREALQNSVDGRVENPAEPVRTVIQIVNTQAAHTGYWRNIFDQLLPHLQACGIETSGVDLLRPRLLLIEDFGTTGLLGSVDRRDNQNFSDFWRRTGRSNKRGRQGGRWGLGKLVFSSASKLRTFFGLTIQEGGSATAYLMGQAVLKNHSLPSSPDEEFAPHGFYANSGPCGLQIPEADAKQIDMFVSATGVRRRDEPGLSIVIPFVHDDITYDAILPHVVRNWFFPILTGNLEVEVGDWIINRRTFAEMAKSHGGAEFAGGHRVSFINELYEAQASEPAVELDSRWTGAGVEASIPEGSLEDLREQYASGKLVSVRAPLQLRAQSGEIRSSFIDLYLKSSPETARGEAFFVRSAITIPGEARRFQGRGCFGALIASEAMVAEFLGDAEGPAHTTWSGKAEKLVGKWKNPAARLKEIRGVLNDLFRCIANLGEQQDPSALIDVFSVPDLGTTGRPRRRRDPVVDRTDLKLIERRELPYRIDGRKGGFAIHGTKAAAPPLRLRVAVAYDVIEGNPLKQFDALDFDFRSSELQMTSSGADMVATAPNFLAVQVTSAAFEISVSGFDEKRDIFVKVAVER